jgi:hypothetical protein
VSTVGARSRARLRLRLPATVSVLSVEHVARQLHGQRAQFEQQVGHRFLPSFSALIQQFDLAAACLPCCRTCLELGGRVCLRWSIARRTLNSVATALRAFLAHAGLFVVS